MEVVALNHAPANSYRTGFLRDESSHLCVAVFFCGRNEVEKSVDFVTCYVIGDVKLDKPKQWVTYVPRIVIAQVRSRAAAEVQS